MKESVRHRQWRDWTKLVTWTVSNTGGILKNEKAPPGYLNKNSNNGKIESARREGSEEEKGLSLFGIPANRAHAKWDSANSNNWLNNCSLKPHANGRNIVGQQLPELLDVTCCVRLHTLLNVVGCCCVLLRKVWNRSNVSANNSQHFFCSVIAEA